MRLAYGKTFLVWEGVTILLDKHESGTDYHVLRGGEPVKTFEPRIRRPDPNRPQRKRGRKPYGRKCK